MKYICDCCAQSKEGVERRRSKLTKGVWFFMCKECINHEPRYWMVLTAKSSGVRSIAKLVKVRAYCLDRIALDEVL